MTIGRLVGITLYPIKSVRGVELSEVSIGPRGLLNDRDWMLVDANGRFVSQRTLGAMAQLVAHATFNGLVIEHARCTPLEVARPVTGPPREVQVWDDRVLAYDAGDAAADWLGSLFGQPLRLVWMPPQTLRPVDPRYAGLPNVPVSFADGFPILITNIASLEDLNRRLPLPIPMARFRPNLMISGWSPFAEDGIRRIRCGDLELLLVKPCTRCSIPTLDHQTGELSTDPTPVLKSFRYDRELHGVTFGVNAIITAGWGSTLRLDEVVCVLD